MRIVFLDVDGVLNNFYTADRICRYVGVSDHLVSRLATLINESNKIEETKIVLSSTWRLEWKSSRITDKVAQEMYDYLTKKLEAQGLPIFSSTKYIEINCRKCFRYLEIEEWLEEHKDLNISSWCILDDQEMLFRVDHTVPEPPGYKDACKNRLVRTSEYDGLTEANVQKALSILAASPEELENERFNRITLPLTAILDDLKKYHNKDSIDAIWKDDEFDEKINHLMQTLYYNGFYMDILDDSDIHNDQLLSKLISPLHHYYIVKVVDKPAGIVTIDKDFYINHSWEEIRDYIFNYIAKGEYK